MQRKVAHVLNLRGRVEYRDEADALIEASGDSVIVERGVLRSFVMSCPDGCGELLTINLDDRTGPAWTLYGNKRGTSLYPSVWRESGCKSHFIVWRDYILWCGRPEWASPEPPHVEDGLVDRVKAALRDELRHFQAIAAELDEIPWEVERCCRRLARGGDAQEGTGRQRGQYRRASRTSSPRWRLTW